MTPEQHLARARDLVGEMDALKVRMSELATERAGHLCAAHAAGWKWSKVAAWLGLSTDNVRQAVTRRAK